MGAGSDQVRQDRMIGDSHPQIIDYISVPVYVFERTKEIHGYRFGLPIDGLIFLLLILLSYKLLRNN